ncbi:YfbK domain-containing protein [Chitinophaga qingshengii]|uniref:von Willebrand factor type A domain-containing protein n=1 Tax=Chitinophaga qingshengii TaxID=1569794 RepID=A0ABR7TWB9_9BACT|nr:von Willebrand factor type A domain-containing protein [Chitinophaga qingshengii]MBC9933913.1 von Willebrand factor type A domain-containing protein [Chitinophaga qingshengii]
MKKYLFLLLLSCLVVIQASAQLHSLTGTVQDKQTHAPIAGAVVSLKKGGQALTHSDKKGRFTLQVPDGPLTLQVIAPNYETATIQIKAGLSSVVVNMTPVSFVSPKPIIQAEDRTLSEVMVTGYGQANAAAPAGDMVRNAAPPYAAKRRMVISRSPRPSTEDYSPINENDFHAVTDQPLSTFSIDVDRAAYSNVRRFLNQGSLPPQDAVRVEEMINYFDYNYKAPAGKDLVAIYTDMAVCPWNTDHQLVRIALKAKQVDAGKLPASNLVFLIDVSGSMDEENKLPLVKRAFSALVQQLRPQDRVAVVVYAGAAGVVLPSTPGSEKKKILEAMESLQAGGSTAGGEGIKLAYKIALENRTAKSNNRVILATDGDFNVGASSDGELQRIIEKERQEGIFLSVLGFGMGNYKDNKLELLADKGNGNYAYIDNFEEARRTFVTEFGGTLFTVAKDVKLQVEFNPAFVQSYRLVGYENRLLANEDFNNDKKDAGDMGVGHTVTALYEIVSSKDKTGKPVNWVDPLKYQQTTVVGSRPEVLTVKLRYKQPDADKSQLMEQVLPYNNQEVTAAPEDFRMATAVAAFGQLLRNSAYKGNISYDTILQLASGAKGDDTEGYRAEFIQLVKKARLLNKDEE